MTKMKSVLHIRLDSPGYSCDAMAAAFIDLGYEYHGLKWQEFRFEHGIEALRFKVIQMAVELKPTIIFCHIQNSEIFDLEMWQVLQKYGFVINYTFDVRVTEKINWMYDVAPHIGHTFFGCMEDVWNCNAKEIYNVSTIHSSCDMDLYKPKRGGMNYAFDVVFCGNKYENTNLDFPLAAERQEMISFLKDNFGNKFQCYGLGQAGGLIKPEVEASVYNFSKIGINQNNFFLNEYSSDRIWRIMASGTFCLTKYFPGIEKIFKKEIDLDWWVSLDELKTLICYYLSEDDERNEIAATGRKKVVQEHSWSARIKEMEKIIAESK